MAAVIGVFENNYKKQLPLPVVKPGTQTRKFTHVEDTVEACISAWKHNKNRHYSISSKKSISIINLAKLFSSNIKLVPERRGERFKSSVVSKVRDKKIINLIGSKSITNYIKEIKKT